MADDGYAGFRRVLERGGSLTVCIPSAIVEHYGIEKGDNVFWSDSADGDSLCLDPAGEL